jgi:hypothetical protein
LAACRARAASTRTRRIIRAVVAKKCARFCQCTGVPVEQADVGLLHEIRRLPSDGLALAREHPARHLPQLALNERSELIQGLRVTTAPRLQQPGHIGDHGPESTPVPLAADTVLESPGVRSGLHSAAEFRLYK